MTPTQSFIFQSFPVSLIKNLVTKINMPHKIIMIMSSGMMILFHVLELPSCQKIIMPPLGSGPPLGEVILPSNRHCHCPSRRKSPVSPTLKRLAPGEKTPRPALGSDPQPWPQRTPRRRQAAATKRGHAGLGAEREVLSHVA